jgi:hypothetical protein
MYSNQNSKLLELYTLLKEDNGTFSGLGGDFVVEDKTALDWKQVGLYEPDTPAETKQTEIALKELEAVLNKFDTSLEAWREKHAKLGAFDAVSREQLGQFIAKSRLNLTRLD